MFFLNDVTFANTFEGLERIKRWFSFRYCSYLFVSTVRQSLSTSPMEIPELQGWAGWGGLECGIEKLKTYSTYHSIPDE